MTDTVLRDTSYELGIYRSAYELLYRKAVQLAEATVKRGPGSMPDVAYGIAMLTLDTDLTTPPEAMRDHARSMLAAAEEAR